jgi:hypothetical protein
VTNMLKRALQVAYMHRVEGPMHILHGAYLPKFTFLHFINNFLNFYYLINIYLFMTRHY